MCSRALSQASSISNGRSPQPSNQKSLLVMSKQMPSAGQSSNRSSSSGSADRQSGKPGDIGSAAESIALRSGGKANRNLLSMRTSSSSESPSSNAIRSVGREPGSIKPRSFSHGGSSINLRTAMSSAS